MDAQYAKRYLQDPVIGHSTSVRLHQQRGKFSSGEGVWNPVEAFGSGRCLAGAARRLKHGTPGTREIRGRRMRASYHVFPSTIVSSNGRPPRASITILRLDRCSRTIAANLVVLRSRGFCHGSYAVLNSGFPGERTSRSMQSLCIRPDRGSALRRKKFRAVAATTGLISAKARRKTTQSLALLATFMPRAHCCFPLTWKCGSQWQKKRARASDQTAWSNQFGRGPVDRAVYFRAVKPATSREFWSTLHLSEVSGLLHQEIHRQRRQRARALQQSRLVDVKARRVVRRGAAAMSWSFGVMPTK